MTPSEHTKAAWRKSSYSEGPTQCVEVARLGHPADVRHSTPQINDQSTGG